MTVYNVSSQGGAYVINSVTNPPLTLTRGLQYTFSVNAPGHPFWIQTTTTPYNSNDVYNSGITNNGIDVGELIFNVPLNAPNTLYYVCEYHSSMYGTINIIDPAVICYSTGTLILTNEGYVPIENIKEGDIVVTKGKISKNGSFQKIINNKEEPVIWISKFKVNKLNSKSRPICIKKDALGQDYPFEDLYVSPAHRLLINDKLVIAVNIINGKTIYQDNTCEFVEYYHLECPDHCAIYANGVLAETYIETGKTRNLFENSIKNISKN